MVVTARIHTTLVKGKVGSRGRSGSVFSDEERPAGICQTHTTVVGSIILSTHIAMYRREIQGLNIIHVIGLRKIFIAYL